MIVFPAYPHNFLSIHKIPPSVLSYCNTAILLSVGCNSKSSSYCFSLQVQNPLDGRSLSSSSFQDFLVSLLTFYSCRPACTSGFIIYSTQHSVGTFCLKILENFSPLSLQSSLPFALFLSFESSLGWSFSNSFPCLRITISSFSIFKKSSALSSG